MFIERAKAGHLKHLQHDANMVFRDLVKGLESDNSGSSKANCLVNVLIWDIPQLLQAKLEAQDGSLVWLKI
jgi:hypothetical protein